MKPQLVLHNNFDLPKGTYFVGDPCYVLPDKVWQAYLDHRSATNGYSEKGQYAFSWSGYKFFIADTKHGDGVFSNSADDNDKHEYGVDSGSLGAVPISLHKHKLDLHPARPTLNDLGRLKEFDKDFECGVGDNREIIIGDVVLPTGGR